MYESGMSNSDTCTTQAPSHAQLPGHQANGTNPTSKSLPCPENCMTTERSFFTVHFILPPNHLNDMALSLPCHLYKNDVALILLGDNFLIRKQTNSKSNNNVLIRPG